MRSFLLIAVLPLALVSCNSTTSREVKITINSDKILSVKDFSYAPASDYSPCNVDGNIEYDISVEPPDFTGMAQVKDAELLYGGKWKKKTSLVFYFKEGRQLFGTNISQYPLADASAEEKNATCASKSSSDIKLVSLGEPVFALSGTKLAVGDNK